MKHTRMIAVALAMVLGTAGVVVAQDSDVGFRGWGPRVGPSINPDQVHFGAHFDFGNFARHVRFQPNLEVGFGDHLDLFTLNAEAAYRFMPDEGIWTPYLGGGVGANIKRVDVDGSDASDTDLGVNVLGGIEKGLGNGDRFFIEGKFSLNDIPDAKATVGWTFYH